jgi:hypothetical protein
MRAGATIRKASAYLTCFDAPLPDNDLQGSGLPVTYSSEDSSVIDDDHSSTRKSTSNETENAAEDAVSPLVETPAPEDKSAAIETQIAAAIEDERHAAREGLRQAREEWTREIADHLAQTFEKAIEGSIDRFREDVAGILRPLVTREVFMQTLERLTDSIRKGLADTANPAIEISGPADMIDKLSRALVDRDIAIIARESEHVDTIIHLGSTTIATDLEAWSTQATSNRRGA